LETQSKTPVVIEIVVVIYFNGHCFVVFYFTSRPWPVHQELCTCLHTRATRNSPIVTNSGSFTFLHQFCFDITRPGPMEHTLP